LDKRNATNKREEEECVRERERRKRKIPTAAFLTPQVDFFFFLANVIVSQEKHNLTSPPHSSPKIDR
jgi:hypothetical protein